MTLYLGTNNPAWLYRQPEIARLDVPLFVSYLRLRRRKSAYPPARVRFAIDSGAFTVHDRLGGWEAAGITPQRFAGDIRRLIAELGAPAFVSIQDLMCEPWILEKTGLTIEEHQERTVQSYLTLKEIAPDVPWLPVLQGWEVGDYLDCLALYRANGVGREPGEYFGLGSVCRRQGTAEAAHIVARLGREGIRLHLFGFKRDGLEKVGNMGHVASSDSMAWSFRGRMAGGPCPLTGNASCADCLHFALDWHEETLTKLRNVARRPCFETVDGSATKQLCWSF
jgi:hypothetical protein